MESYNLEQKPDETLVQYYRRLAKTADQRMVRLKKASEQPYFKVATEWAYAKATRDILKWIPPGDNKSTKLRFNTKPPEGEDLIAKINDIKSFLSSPTSSKQGIINVYKKRADTVNKKYGTNFTWKQLAKYYDSGQAELWDAKFGSKTALLTIAAMQKNKKKIKEAIQKADKKDIRISSKDNSMIQKTVNMALKENNLKIEDLL